MPRTILPLTHPILKVADTQAGLTAGEAYECQLTRAEIVPTAQTSTVPATGCAPAVDVPGATKYALHLEWLQDWTASGGGLSNYALINDGSLVWFEYAVDSVGAPTVVATGQAYVTPGSYGGVFGDGSAAAATADWSMPDKPSVVVPVTVAADEDATV
jgi:hypothetical protein